MSPPPISAQPIQKRVATIYRNAILVVLAAWLIGFAALMLLWVFSLVDSLAIAEMTVISVASGVVSLFGLVPGFVVGATMEAKRRDQPSVAMVGCVAAMAIRSSGTVALFVACRYHFGEASKVIVFLVVGWYLYLTLVEVLTLARGIASLDRSQLISLKNA